MTDSGSNKPKFGLTDEDLWELPTVYQDKLFEDKVVLVSGGGSGIGKAIAFLYARLGATLIICGRDESKLETTRTLVESRGLKVLVKQTNIRDPESVQDLMDTIWKKYGRLDILINNAGGQFPMESIDFSINGWNAVVDTNLNGTFYMMQTAAKKWRDHDQPGHIVNIVAVFNRGMPGIAHTCAARAAVTYLSKTVAVEWAPYKIQVNCVAPGTVESTGFHQYPEEGVNSFKRSNPMLKVGDVQDVAEACAYLTADSGKFITGEQLIIDGGGAMWGDAWPAGKPDYFKFDD